MIITTKQQFLDLRAAGRKLAEVAEILVQAVKPGISTWEIDQIGRAEIQARDSKPSFLNYGRPPFPAAICTSVNQTIVHGIPSKDIILKEGDIIGLDLGLIFQGFYTDMAVTVAVGEISPEKKKLIAATKEALSVGIKAGLIGQRVGIIGAAIEEVWKKYGYSTPRELSGHGVGAAVHEAPTILNYGPANSGPNLRDGEVIAIEPMLNAGSHKIRVAANQWDILTADGQPSAHFEHTILYTSKWPEPYIITTLGQKNGDDGAWWK